MYPVTEKGVNPNAVLINGYDYIPSRPDRPTDRTLEDDGAPYALTYSTQFGYVSLLRQHPRDGVEL